MADDRRPPRPGDHLAGAHLLREGGAFYDADAHWLTVTPGASSTEAVRIVHDAGDREFAYVVGQRHEAPAGSHRGLRAGPDRSRSSSSGPDVTLDVVTYRRSG